MTVTLFLPRRTSEKMPSCRSSFAAVPLASVRFPSHDAVGACVSALVLTPAAGPRLICPEQDQIPAVFQRNGSVG